MGGQRHLTIESAASRLGYSRQALYKALGEGRLASVPGSGPACIAPAELERFRRQRQAVVLEKFRTRGVDVVEKAKALRSFLRPLPGGPAFGPGWQPVEKAPRDLVDAFGVHVAKAAMLRDGTCRWCAAEYLAVQLGAPIPVYGEALAVLLGEPCERDARRLYVGAIEQMRAQVKGPAERPPEARSAPAQGPRRTPAAPAPQSVRTGARRAVTAAAQSSRRTALADEQFTVTRRVELQAALSSAMRASDHKYAAQLRHLIKAL